MPRGGNNRKPKQQKIIHGTFRGDRNPKNEPDPTVLTEIPKPPTSLNRYGKKLWKQIVPELIDTGLLTAVDLPALEILCDLFGTYKELHDSIYKPVDPETGRKTKRTLSEYMDGRNSQTQPEYSAMKAARQDYKSFATEFGLTPLARNRIDIPTERPDIDPMEELLDAE